jgi:hypothetical protein
MSNAVDEGDDNTQKLINACIGKAYFGCSPSLAVAEKLYPRAEEPLAGSGEPEQGCFLICRGSIHLLQDDRVSLPHTGQYV